MSRQLEYMKQAHADVQAVQRDAQADHTAYGALCHQVPIYVLTNGLALTAAYIESKANGNNPHGLVKHHLARVIEVPDRQALSAYVAGLSTERYMLATFAVLDAWTFYKRFAESILNVKPGADADLLEASATDG